METGPRYVGQPVPRIEDRRLLTGAAAFLDDVSRPGQLHARIVRSDVAHGRIAAIDTAAARACEGVVGVFTGDDLPDVRIPIRIVPTDEAQRALQPPLARGRVRYVGEPLAVVVATDPYLAEDAAEEVWAEIEPLPPVVDASAAADAPRLHEALEGNLAGRLSVRHGEPVEALFAAADIVVTDDLAVQRHTALPLETRGLLAEVDATTGRLTMWGAAKVKHFNRRVLAGLLELPLERIRFVEQDVGGGFGPRGEFYPEDFVIPWLALTLGRPVKWVEDRREHFVATNHSREMACRMQVAARADGTLLGFRASVRVDLGGYVRTHGLVLAKNALSHLAGPYAWAGFEGDATGVLTNKTPAGTYRGPGQYEPTFFRERMLDRVAAEAGIDPAELRARNLIAVERLPYEIDLGETEERVVYDGGDFPLLWGRLMTGAGYDALAADAAAARGRGECAGVGVAAFTEVGGRGPYEWARVAPTADGGFTVHVGIASVGQGIATGLAQVAADGLGVPLERVTISHQDTDAVPEGNGAFSSRSAVFGGNAVAGAVDDLLARALAAGAEALGVEEAEVEVIHGGIVRERGHPDRALAIADLGCEGDFRFEKHERSFYMGAALVLVRVDPETGAAVVERCVVACDVGRAINPLIIDGQLAGAAVQGIGGAVLEELSYSDEGQPLTTSFLDYAMPGAAELPAVETIVLELGQHRKASANPLGIKGAGEGGIVAIGAAVANGAAAALGERGAALSALPLSPDRVYRIVRSGGP